MKKIIALFSIFTLSSLLSACETPRYGWYKQGVNKQDTLSQYRKCEYELVGVHKVSPEQEQRLMKACMEKEGFRWVRM